MDAPTHLDLPVETLLKAVDVAHFLNISRAYAYQLMQRGEIPTVKIGTACRVRLVDLKAYIRENLHPNPRA
ncbi:MAG: helix-turn-helix domain-containing protein [Anaerolineales bacterium]|nr:helix-turn-helix domain-containing protein [Anaerolineales bacterium]